MCICRKRVVKGEKGEKAQKEKGEKAQPKARRSKKKTVTPEGDVVVAVPKKKRGRKPQKETTASEFVKKDKMPQSLLSQAGEAGDILEVDPEAAEQQKAQDRKKTELTMGEQAQIWKNKRVGTYRLPVNILE